MMRACSARTAACLILTIAINRAALFSQESAPVSTSLLSTAASAFVERGTFQMGNSEFPSWGTVHRVRVDSFYISEQEITCDEYVLFLNSAGVSAEGMINGNTVYRPDSGTAI